MNSQYRKNLKAILEAHKTYTDNAINDLRWELGSHTLDVESDTTTSFSKSVPSGAIGCQINKIGGMSYKTTNLIVLTDVAETTENGITYKVENGGLYLNGTATANIGLIIPLNSNIVLNGTYYYRVFGNLGRYLRIRNSSDQAVAIIPNSSATINDTATYLYMWIDNGTVISNEIGYPMLVTGSTAPTTFSQGFTGIRDSAVSQLKINSANLLQLDDMAETTTNGITYSVSNGVITLNGTASANGLLNPFYLTNNVYMNGNFTLKWFSGLADNQNIGVDVYFNGTALNVGDSEVLSRSYDNVTLSSIRFYIPSGYSFTNFKLKPMIVKGSTAPTEYKPYVTPIIKNIPSEIQALTGYGWGISESVCNYIDYNNKKFIQMVGRYTFTGNETFSKINKSYGTTQLDSLIKTLDNNAKVISALIVGFTPDNANNVYDGVNNNTVSGIAGTTPNRIRFYSDSFNSATDVQTTLTGKTLYYELATPIETDISQYLTTDTIDVEPLGTIEFTNTYSQAVPSDIDFLIEEVKA